jgi:hypothetical protein
LPADIERLEASLRRLRQQSGELRGSHTNAFLPECPDRIIAGNAELSVGAARSLEPKNLVPRALMGAQRGNMESALASRSVPLLMLIAGLVAASIAYFAPEKSSSAPEKIREAKFVAVEPQVIAAPAITKPESEPEDGTVAPEPMALPPGSVPQIEMRASKPSDTETGTTSDNKASPDVVSPPPAALSPPEAAVVSQEGVPTASLPASRSERSEAPAAAPVRTLSRADIQLLMKQGQAFMAVGDVAAARVVFRRAAEAGDAAAALAMGTTYDPLVLKRMGALGVTPDPYQARSWYERAKDFGSPEAPRRIEMIANR